MRFSVGRRDLGHLRTLHDHLYLLVALHPLFYRRTSLCLFLVAYHHHLVLRRVSKSLDLCPILSLHLSPHLSLRLHAGPDQSICLRALVPGNCDRLNRNLPRHRDELVVSLDLDGHGENENGACLYYHLDHLVGRHATRHVSIHLVDGLGELTE